MTYRMPTLDNVARLKPQVLRAWYSGDRMGTICSRYGVDASTVKKWAQEHEDSIDAAAERAGGEK